MEDVTSTRQKYGQHTYGLLFTTGTFIIHCVFPHLINCKTFVHGSQEESVRHQKMSDRRKSEWMANPTWKIILWSTTPAAIRTLQTKSKIKTLVGGGGRLGNKVVGRLMRAVECSDGNSSKSFSHLPLTLPSLVCLIIINAIPSGL